MSGLLAPETMQPDGGGPVRRSPQGEGGRMLKTRAFAAAMRRRGMSETGIRRALGLSPRQANEAGLFLMPETAPLTESTATPAASPPPEAPSMNDVLSAVAGAGRLHRRHILGRNLKPGPSALRNLTMLLIRELCPDAGLEATGRFLGRHHTTVHYGCRAAQTRLDQDAAYRRLRAAAERELGRGGNGNQTAGTAPARNREESRP